MPDPVPDLVVLDGVRVAQRVLDLEQSIHRVESLGPGLAAFVDARRQVSGDVVVHLHRSAFRIGRRVDVAVSVVRPLLRRAGRLVLPLDRLAQQLPVFVIDIRRLAFLCRSGGLNDAGRVALDVVVVQRLVADLVDRFGNEVVRGLVLCSQHRSVGIRRSDRIFVRVVFDARGHAALVRRNLDVRTVASQRVDAARADKLAQQLAIGVVAAFDAPVLGTLFDHRIATLAAIEVVGPRRAELHRIDDFDDAVAAVANLGSARLRVGHARNQARAVAVVPMRARRVHDLGQVFTGVDVLDLALRPVRDGGDAPSVAVVGEAQYRIAGVVGDGADLATRPAADEMHGNVVAVAVGRNLSVGRVQYPVAFAVVPAPAGRDAGLVGPTRDEERPVVDVDVVAAAFERRIGAHDALDRTVDRIELEPQVGPIRVHIPAILAFVYIVGLPGARNAHEATENLHAQVLHLLAKFPVRQTDIGRRAQGA
ncbi:MAG TPA: hypothetical protein VJ724_13245 [Tahibacter sp.]|nr:hypothetical protein [Tahibacter sp.]